MKLPRVTEMLAAAGLAPDFGMVRPDILEAACLRGQAVHRLIEAHHYGYLDDEEITPEAGPYLMAYEKFLTESLHEPVASEIEVIHPGWQYVGHPDRIGWLVGRRWLLDWKCTETPDLQYAGRQLTLYRLAWNAMHPAWPVERMAVVQLKRDRSFRLHELSAGDHEQAALAAVVVYQTRQREGRL